jgi:hypothetical protein
LTKTIVDKDPIAYCESRSINSTLGGTYFRLVKLDLLMILSFSQNNWLRRRWLDFRNGHSTYLIFAMTFANFITIQYKLLIDKVPSMDWLFGSIWLFAIIFIAIYVPLAIFIGYWHRKTQWTVEQEALFRENKVGAVLWLYIMDLIEGKVNEQDKKKMRDALLKITKGSTSLYDLNKVMTAEPTESKTSDKPGI